MITWKDIEKKIKTEKHGDCLLITYPKMVSRNVRVSFGKNKYNVRKMFYETHIGSIGHNQMLFTTCGNSNCLNPDHIELVDIRKPKPPKKPKKTKQPKIKEQKIEVIDGKYFLSRVSVTKNERGCWISNKKTTPNRPYPQINFKGKSYSLHRFSYMCFNGVIPVGYVVMHTCDNPACCNPDHLIIGTKKDNTQDMLSKNRQSKDGFRRKLRDDQVREIRRSELSSYKLSEIYNVTASYIRRIKNGKRR